MVLKYRSGISNRAKCTLTLPLLLGFVVGILSVYTYYLLLNCYQHRKLIPVAIKQGNSQKNLNYYKQYYRVDLTKPSINHNTSLLCLIFINDTDSLLMQQNIWLNKCGKNKLYVSKHKHILNTDHVITSTYSSHPWKYYCQTLTYLQEKYNSGIIRYRWIFLAKDDIWLIYENLIHLISILSVNKHKHNYYAGQYVDGILNTNAGILLTTNALRSLVELFNNVDACNTMVSYSESEMLDFYLKKLNNITPVSNMDSYGCSLFHSINVYEAFKAKRLEKLQTCISRCAITFKLNLTSNYHAMFYKYVLYKVRLVTKNDLLPNAKNIIPAPSPKDENIWWIEALYELNVDPRNMSQPDFYHYWSKKRKIIL